MDGRPTAREGSAGGVVSGRGPVAVPGLRAWLGGVLSGWGAPEQVLDDEVLDAGELLGSASRHGQGTTMAVEVTWDGLQVRCAVTHAGTGTPPSAEWGCGPPPDAAGS